MRDFASLLALATSLAFAGMAHAESAAATAEPQATNGGQPALEEIVVTAQKRSENLQNVPIAVSAITASALQSKGVNGVLDLQQAVPNLNISYANGVVNTSLRGIGTNAIAPGFENSVATYIDGVYIASQIGSFTNLANISQIAVLKGPQGTLFGRNATGGVLQITTREPTSEPVVEGTIGYGNYQTVSGTLYMGGAVASNLNADISVYGLSMGKGYGKSYTTGADLYRTKHDIVVRSKWVWNPTETTKITLIGDYADTLNTNNSVILLPGTISGYNPSGGRAPDLGYNSTSDVKNFVKGWAAGGTLKIDQKLGELSLVSISAYRQSQYSSKFDFDGTVLPGGTPGDGASYKWPDKQFSQELQLQSAQNGKFKWTLGAYYYYGQTAYDPLIVTLNSAGIELNVVDRLRTNSIAGFAQGTYELAEGTNLTLGARYTHETRRAYDGETGVTLTAINLPLGVTPAADDTATFNKFTFRIALDHRFSSEVLGYASFNRGFKSGGFNLSNPGLPPYRPETLDNYEVGLKTDLFDRRLRVNLAGFYGKYSDVQSQILDTNSGGVIFIVNAAKARTYGLDLDLQARLSSNLDLSGGLGLVNAKYSSYPDSVISTPLGGTPVTFGSAKGNRLPLSSPFTASFGFTYHTQVGAGELSLSPNVYYNDGQYFESDNVIHQSAYAHVNTTLKWESADKHYSVTLWGKNLTDKRILSWAATTPNGTHVGNYAPPRTYGVSIGFKY